MATATNSQIVYGLYAAIYVRSPDKAGYDYWMAGLNAVPPTATLSQIATGFSQRPEWVAAYPTTMTDVQYVDAIYQNVLGIAGDAAGRAFWAGNITAGAYNRTDFIVQFLTATIEFDATLPNFSGLTAAEVASATSAQTTILNKIAVGEAFVASPAAINPAKTGVDSAGNYNAANDMTVALLTATDSTQASVDAAKAAITAAGAAGTTFTLTTAGDTLTTLTALNDTVTGVAGTLTTNDVIVDVTTTDADVLTAAGVAAGTAPKISSVETLNISNNFATGLDLANITGVTALNLSATLANGNAVVANAKMAAATTITAGTNIAELLVATNSKGTGGSVAINAGAATKVTLTGSAAVDTLALTTTGDVTIAAGGGSPTLGVIEALTLTANAAAGTGTGTAAAATAVVTLDSAKALLVAGVDATFDIAGTSNVELKADVLALDGRTVTKSSTGTLTATLGQLTPPTAATIYDLAKVAATTFNVGTDLGANATLKLEHGSNVSTTATQTNLSITNASQIGLTNTAATQTKISSDTIKALTITSNAPILTGVDVTYDAIDLTGTSGANFTGSVLNLLGGTVAAPQDVKIKAGKVETVDASKLVGTVDYTHSQLAGALDLATATAPTMLAEKFTFTGSAGADKLAIAAPSVVANLFAKANITATLGDGDDTVTLPGIQFVAGSTLKIDAGVGTADTLALSAGTDVSDATLTLTAVESLALGGGTATFAASQLTGQTYNIKGSTAIDDNLTIKGVAATLAVDATALKLDAAVETLTIDGKAAAAGQTLKGFASTDISIKTANVITGGKFSDTITGGSSDDKITGGKGTDKLSGGQGADTFYFDAADSVALVDTPVSMFSFDTITDFTKGTIGGTTVNLTDKVMSNTVTLINAPTNLVAADGTAAISVNGVATFHANNATATSHLAAVQTAVGTTVGASVVWGEGADTFLLINGALPADDTLVKFAGITLTATDTLASFVSAAGVVFKSTTASAGNDDITGTPSNDDGSTGNGAILDGQGGDDTLTGLAGNDTFNIGVGNDKITDLSGGDNVTVLTGATVSAKVTAAWTPTVTTKNGAATVAAATVDANGFAVDLSKVTTGIGWTVTNTSATGSSIAGSALADNLTGGAGNDTFVYTTTGLAGGLFDGANALTDSITGGGGTDTVLVGVTGTAFGIINTESWAKASAITTIKAAANDKAVSIDLKADAATAGITTVDLSLTTGIGVDKSAITVSTFTTATTLIGSTATGIVDIIGGDGVDTITAAAGGGSITAGKGNDVIKLAAATAVDTVVFSAVADNGVDTITGFAKANDQLQLAALGTITAEVDITGTKTAGTNTYLLGGLAAGKADTLVDAAAAITAGATWTAASVTAFAVLSDDNSTSIYKWVDVIGTNGAQSTELTLIGTVDAAMTTGDLGTAVLIA